MDFDELLAVRIRDALRRRKRIDEVKMFGGIGFMLNGDMLVAVWKKSLVARVGPDAYEEVLLERQVTVFDITGKAMKGWVLVGPAGVAGENQLADWIQRAARYVGKLDAK